MHLGDSTTPNWIFDVLLVVWVLSGLVLCTAPTDLNDHQFRVILTEDVETESSFLDPMEETPQLLLY
jgi:hypothetical protein